MEPTDLAAERAKRRQQLREESSHVTVALPLDGSVSTALGHLEEVLLLVDLTISDSDPLPTPLAEREASDAVGRLGGYVAWFDRAAEEDRPVVQPVAPDGRYELVPLCFALLDRDDHARVLGALRALAATRTAGSHPGLDEALSDYARDPQDAERLVATAERLAALLELAWDGEVDLLSARLAPGATSPRLETARVVLTPEEYAAYLRMTERILATWHADDPLERFLYRGSSPSDGPAPGGA